MNMYVECFFSIISFAMYEFCVRDYFDANANQFINVILSATSEKVLNLNSELKNIY